MSASDGEVNGVHCTQLMMEYLSLGSTSDMRYRSSSPDGPTKGSPQTLSDIPGDSPTNRSLEPGTMLGRTFLL